MSTLTCATLHHVVQQYEWRITTCTVPFSHRTPRLRKRCRKLKFVAMNKYIQTKFCYCESRMYIIITGYVNANIAIFLEDIRYIYPDFYETTMLQKSKNFQLFVRSSIF